MKIKERDDQGDRVRIGLGLISLHELCVMTNSDFAAITGVRTVQEPLRWLQFTGNRNRRIASMTVKPGRGLAGMAIRWAIPCHYAALAESGVWREECPIMLAEQLLDAVAIPLLNTHEAVAPLRLGPVSHVIVIGRRSAQPYLPTQWNQLLTQTTIL